MADKDIKEGDQGMVIPLAAVAYTPSSSSRCPRREMDMARCDTVLVASGSMLYPRRCLVIIPGDGRVRWRRILPIHHYAARNSSCRTWADSLISRTVSWKWSGSRPGGEVAEVKEEGEAKITTKNNNEVKKNAEPDNPAVVIERSGNNVVKKASELEVEEAGDKHEKDKGEEKEVTKDDEKKAEEKPNGEAKANGTSEEKKEKDESEDKKDEDESKKENGETESKANGDSDPKGKENGESEKKNENGEPAKNGTSDAETGDKRKAEDDSAEDQDETAPSAKKQKTDDNNDDDDKGEAQSNGQAAPAPAPRKKGRPAKNAATPKKDAKKKEPKKAATESGEPRRSGRNRS
jgi:hypothetical protein